MGAGSLPDDTIFAVASGVGRAAVAVMRLSGPDCRAVLQALVGGVALPPRRASLRLLRAADGGVLDQALVLWMPAPASFTGEDQVEFHLHGGLAVRAAMLRELSSRPGCRPAEPGEFTRRAFLNRKLDLTSVEGLGDLIDAETEAQRRQAIRQLAGGLSERIVGWRETIADLLALIEAGLDFSDEDDTPREIDPAEYRVIGNVRAEIGALLAEGHTGERLREGFAVVIAGPPNAGKSTLLNAIARRDVAIVSEIPGTTRDAIEVRCDLGGLPVTLVDTAGLRATSDAVEREGVRRATARMEDADLVLWLVPSDDPALVQPPDGATVGRVLVVRTKVDLAPADAAAGLAVSARTGAGLSILLETIGQSLSDDMPGSGGALVTRERHRQALLAASSCLARAEAAGHKVGAELLAEDLRLTLRALGRIVGDVDVEDILDRIFSQFCIGK